MNKNKIAIALASALLLPVTGVSFAQSTQSTSSSGSTDTSGQSGSSQSSPDQNKTKQLQTVVVTGSALPRIDTETASPIQTLTAADIERSGYTTVSDAVRAISADNSGSIPNSFTNGFAAGSSAVALRGLTAQATLVLIDGQRSASYAAPDDGTRSFVDLNSIPLVAVERIEVLKDGASSLYGGDAVAGVVNIILKPSYQGVEMNSSVGTDQHAGGFSKKASILGGTGDLNKDGYNVYFGMQYESDQSIQASSRPFPFNTNNLSSIGGQDLNFPGADVGSTIGSVVPGTLATPGNILTGVPIPGAAFQPLGACTGKSTLVKNNPGLPAGSSYCEQSLTNLYGQVQPQSKQLGLYTRGTFKINDDTKLYVSASYTQYTTFTVAPPTQIQQGVQTNTTNIALPPTIPGPNGTSILNPNNPFAAQGEYALINYAFGDIPQGDEYQNHNFRLVGDLTGKLGDNWNYDANMVINRTWLDTTQQGFVTSSGLINAVTNGTYNFVNPSANTAAELHSLAPGLTSLATSDLDSLSFGANRELWDMAGGPVGLAVGAQFRYEDSNYPEFNPMIDGSPVGEFQQLGLAASSGQRTVKGAYFELDAPLTSTLEADLGGRYDYYSDAGNNFSPKLGLKWQPLDWLAVRGTASKGFIAPAFAENGANSINEGFAGETPPAAFQAAHGNDAYSQTYDVGILSAGNPKLTGEKSTSFTFGVVVQPTDWMSMSADYYHIRITNLIVGSDYSAALADYYAGTPVPAANKITENLPDPLYPNALPTAVAITAQYINAPYLSTNGIDLNLHTHFKFSNGMEWITDVSPTEIFNYREAFPDGQVYSFVGTQGPYELSSGAGTPRLKGTFANTLIYGPLTTTLTMNYVSSYAEIAEDAGIFPDTDSCLSTTPAETPFPASCRSGSFTDFDLTASYAINDKVSITADIMNLFNKLPPLDPADYAGGALNYNPTYAQAGLVGRYYNLGVKIKL
jgi:iron complex outermembrane receptor protein